MSLKLKSYDICILDLVCDHKTGKLSTVKIWAHVANGIMSKVMLTQSVDWELMAAYGAIVGGSYVGLQFLKWRYRDAPPVADSPKLGVE